VHEPVQVPPGGSFMQQIPAALPRPIGPLWQR